MPEETLKYTADFSQISAEIDKINDKIGKLSASLERTAQKFGKDSPQATMVKTALDRVMADLDKKITAFEKMQRDATKSGGAGGGGGTDRGGRGSSDADLRRRYERESLKYYRDFSATFGKTGKAIGGGLLGLATGEGLGGFARGFSELGRHLMQQATKNNTLTQGLLLGGAGSKGAIAGKVRSASAGKSAATAEEGEVAAGVEEAVSVGAGIGIMRAFAAIPGPVKWAIGGLMALAGADLKLTQMASSDIYGRTRRAGGFGTTAGPMTAFEDTMNRFVDPDQVLKSAQQAKFDITSPAYTAMRIAGINPSEWKDPTAMAEGNIAEAQTELKKMYAANPQTLLTMAHARGFAARGFSDEDIIRLAQGDQSEVNKLLKKAQAAGPGLEITDEQRKAWDDLITDVTLAGDGVRKWGEDILQKQIPTLDNFALKIQQITGLIDPITPSGAAAKSPLAAAIVGGGGTPDAGAGGGTGAPGGVRRRGSGGPIPAPDGRPSTTYTGPAGEGWENKWGSASGSTQPGSTEGWGLQPGFKEKIDKMLAAGAAAGYPATINEGFRSFAYQAMLYRKLHGIGPVAAPGGSWHEKGMAVDLTTKGLQWYIKHASEFGIYPGSNFGDPGHFQDHSGRAADWPAYTPHWVPRTGDGPAKTSMNNNSHFQGSGKQMAIRIDNPAGASYQVSGGMLGASQGNYGNA